MALVTPLSDGMNLVAKEFVVAQAAGDGAGVLILSEFAGAAEQLDEAIRCNPFDVEGVSRLIENALDLDHDDCRERIAAMAAKVHRYDVFTWVDQVFADAKQAAPPGRV